MSGFDDYRDLCEERDQLRAELEAARADAKEAWEKLGEQCIAHTATIQKLAAEQAKNVELLEIAKKGLRHYENRNIAHGTRNPAAIALDEIAATPSDTSALEAIIERAGEVMREQCADYLDRYGEVSQRRSEEIRALPAVTLEDLK